MWPSPEVHEVVVEYAGAAQPEGLARRAQHTLVVHAHPAQKER